MHDTLTVLATNQPQAFPFLLPHRSWPIFPQECSKVTLVMTPTAHKSQVSYLQPLKWLRLQWSDPQAKLSQVYLQPKLLEALSFPQCPDQDCFPKPSHKNIRNAQFAGARFLGLQIPAETNRTLWSFAGTLSCILVVQAQSTLKVVQLVHSGASSMFFPLMTPEFFLRLPVFRTRRPFVLHLLADVMKGTDVKIRSFTTIFPFRPQAM